MLSDSIYPVGASYKVYLLAIGRRLMYKSRHLVNH